MLIKKLSISLASLVAVMAVAFTASAATLTNLEFNGDSSVKANANATVGGVLRVVVPAGEEVEYVQTDIPNDNRAPVCHDVSDQVAGTQYLPLSIKMSEYPNTTSNIEVTTYGVLGTGVSNGCDPMNQNGFQSFNSVLVTNSNTAVQSDPSFFCSWMPWFCNGNVSTPAPTVAPTATPVPTPSVSAECKAYSDAKVGTVMNVRANANIAFQGFLLSKHASIPALAAGASFGVYGPQTQSAEFWFNGIYHCN